MTAATRPFPTAQLNPNQAFPTTFPNGLQVNAGTVIYAGTLVAWLISAGGVPLACRPQDSGAIGIIGVAKRTIDMTVTPAPTGYAADMQIDEGIWGHFYNDGTVLSTSIGQPVYAVDDSTLSLSSNGGTRLRAGTTYGLMPSTSPMSGRVTLQLSPSSSAAGGDAANLPQIVTLDVPLATIQAKTSGVAFSLMPAGFGSSLPPNSQLVASNIKVIAPITGSGSTCTAQVQRTGETAGSLLGGASGADMFGAGSNTYKAGGGTNPYSPAGGNTLTMTLTSGGGTLAGMTGGHIQFVGVLLVTP